MSRIVFVLGCFFIFLLPDASFAWGYKGHRVAGSIADQLLTPNARQQVSQILGFELRIAGPWADCVKSVVRNDEGTFEYKEDPNHPEYEIPCTSFRTDVEQARMEDYVKRNWTQQCEYKPDGIHERGCHNTYHFDDVAIQRDHFDRDFQGTNTHDLVGAIGAAIAVLLEKPVPPPFSIADKKEALFLLAHLVGDLHQPLHVGAVYLDDGGHLVDPDIAHKIDPATETVGGNSILDLHANLHFEWDEIPPDLGEAATKALMSAARAVPKSQGSVESWPVAWASDTIVVSHDAFAGTMFARAPRGRWTVTFENPDAYLQSKDSIQRQQLAKAGARLAELMNAIWP